MSKNSTRFPIVNGLFGGRAEISLREALRLFASGSAKPDDIRVETVNGRVDHKFYAVRLTFSAYDKIVAGSLESAKAKTAKRTVAEERAMHTGDYASVLPVLQREELYQGYRDENSSGPVTSVQRTLRKARVVMIPTHPGGWLRPSVEFHNWRERDGFPRKRFNPDHLAVPLMQRASAQ